MQTRRDQLHAYRFQNRRALAALVSGEPNVVEPPMRRLTVTTISGIMIAILVTVGFTLYGFIRPEAGDSWKEAGAIVVEQDTGATYVYLGGVLHPVVNYTSGVLAVGEQKPHTVEVGRDDIADAPRGAQIGVPGLPSSLPGAGALVSAPISACSRLRPAAGDDVSVRVTVRIGRGLGAGARPVGAGTGVLVDTGAGSQGYLLLDGRRLAVGGGRTETSLGLSDRQPLQVGHAFLDAVPPGPALRAPALPGQGRPAGLRGVDAVVGQLLKTSDTDYYVVMSDGVARVNGVQRALLQTLPLGPGGAPLDPVSTSPGTALGLPTSADWSTIVTTQLAGLPADIPSVEPAASGHGGVCAVFRAGSEQPTFVVPPSSLPSYQPRSVVESDGSRQGRADAVELPPGRAAMVRSTDGATVYLVGDIGTKFAATTSDVLGRFGYDPKRATALPAALLSLVPSGPALDPGAARRAVVR
ncbi:type VII secretion protein EccB [Jatrophihabitans endophyticus]|uniref:Type VII secretion protein EccB n=1 Tax=Jatrophihabitans endophyticus TaxID=1206085 RepID=A0A1M5LXJ0_9ACTN|nr:type VII secretion protein EccB [Jatrophihabitans endophyticus]